MSRNTNFDYSFLVLAPRKRKAILAVWDFCRAIDDTVDENILIVAGQANLKPWIAINKTDALNHWRQEVARCFEGKKPLTRQGLSLQLCLREFNLPRDAFEDLIDGVGMDLAHKRYTTFQELTEYCRRVASTVGLICIEIFGYRDPRTRDYAINLGIALQLTNIIRDVATDYAKGRVYLPLEDLQRFRCTEVDLGKGDVTPKLRALLEYQCQRAHRYYALATSTLPTVDVKRVVAAEIMGGIYFEILCRVERLGYDVFTRHIHVPRSKRALIAATVWCGRRWNLKSFGVR